MHCINKSHFEVKNLAEKLGDSLDVTAAKIAIWQEDNNEYDRFPTYEELTEEGDLSTMYNDAVEQLERFNNKEQGVFTKDTISLSKLKKEYPLLNIIVESINKDRAKLNASFKKVVDKAYTKLKEFEDNKRTREFESLKRKNEEEEGKILLSVQDYKPTHSIDPFVQQKYFSTGRIQKSSDVLQKIIEVNSEYRNFAKTLLPLVKRINDVDIILRPTKSIQTSSTQIPEAPGVFFSVSNTIEIAQHAKHYARRSEGLILHEILHAISYKQLLGSSQINSDFKTTYDKAISVLGTYNPSTKEGLYGTYNIDEFFVALFTDAKLIKALENIDAVDNISYKNLFEEIFDIILNLLNFKRTNNLYTQAFSIATNIIDADRIEREEQEYRIQAELERDAFQADMEVNQKIYDEMFAEQKTLASLPYESKPGVEDLFDSNPELASIGTPQQYSQYLDTIFPDSKVKDILYHGSKNKFDKFDNQYKGSNLGKVSSDSKLGFFFGNLELSERFGDIKYPSILSIENPLIVEEDTRQKDKINVFINSIKSLLTPEGEEEFYGTNSRMQDMILSSFRVDNYNQLNDRLKEYEDILSEINTKEANFNSEFTENQIKTALQNNNDAVILNYDVKDSSVRSKQYIVFNPEQIHILGTNSDIEGFREFVNTQTLPKFKPKVFEYNQDFEEISKVLLNLDVNKTLLNFVTPSTIEFTLQNAGFSNEMITQLTDFYSSNKDLMYSAPNIYEVVNAYVSSKIPFGKTEIVKKADKELENKLLKWLEPLNINVKDLNDFKKNLNVNALGIADIINKTIYLAKERQIDTLPEEVAHFYVEFLEKRNKKGQSRNYLLYDDLINKIESWSEYQKYYDEYSNIYVKDGVVNIEKVKKEIIGKAIAEAVVRRFETKDLGLYSLIQEVIDYLRSIFKNRPLLNIQSLADDIAEKILSEDYSDIKKDLSENVKLRDYKAVPQEVRDIIHNISSAGATMTGSIALRKAGTVYREDGEEFHDLDFKVSSTINREAFLNKIKKIYPSLNLKSEFQSGSSYTTLWNITVNGKIYDIDFFFETKPYNKLDNFVHWADTFAAKLDLGRAKDVTDFINYKPYKKFSLFPKKDVVIDDYLYYQTETLPKFKPVGYKHKAHQIILDNLDKIKGWEKQIKDSNILYRKIQELGVPKMQMELFINSDGNTVEEKLLSFLSNYSYTVEINVAKEEKTSVASDQSGNPFDKLTTFKLGDITYVTDGWDLQYFSYDSNNNITTLTRNQYKAALEQFKLKNTKETPTQYYANLTVPGGTNYTENEIATPQIIPSIKGHGQFATDNGIGWFRSDEQIDNINDNRYDSFAKQLKEEGYSDLEIKQAIDAKRFSTNKTDSKTRRILEVQSDLFQKGRDKKLLAGYNIGTIIETDKGKFKILDVFNRAILDNQGQDIGTEEVAELENLITGVKGKVKTSDVILKTGNKSENQFLQLLNKDNNWVTFFIKSIIQDSAKKKYEKVLFPSGNTASKVEGHTTLEEFKRDKEDRIKKLELDKQFRIENTPKILSQIIETQEKLLKKNSNNEKLKSDLAENKFKLNNPIDTSDLDNEINQLKQELARVETEGLAALKPIYNFYENNVANVLKKQGYNPALITDEYGNTWNEVELDEERDLEDIKFKVRPKNTLNNIEKEKFKRSINPGDKTTFKHWNEDSSIVEEHVDINIGEVFDDDFEGYYNEDNKQKFRYENVISNERPNKYDIEEQAIFKNKLYVGANVMFYVDNVKIEGNITEVGSSMFSVAVDDEIKTFEYSDIDAENHERNISELVYGVKEILRKQLKAFSKKVTTEEQVERLASVEKALFQLENYKGIDDLLDFMKTVQKSIAKSNALLNNLERKDLPVEKKLAMMSYVKDYIKSFDIMKQLASQINKLDGSEKLKGVSNALLTDLILTEENYYDRVIPELADWLWSVFPENLNKELIMTKQKPWTKERLIQELRSPSGDLDFLNTYLVPTTNANDVITGLFSKILKRALDAARYAAYTIEQSIKPAFKKVQEKFGDMEEVYKNFYTIKDFEVMENGEKKTKKVRYIIEQYNLREYYDTIQGFKKQTNELWKKLKETESKTEKDVIKAEIDKIDAKKLAYQKDYGSLVNASKMKADMEALRDKNSPKFNYDTFGTYLTYFYKLATIPTKNSLEVIDKETGEVTYYEYKENRWEPDKSKFETEEYKQLSKGDEDIFNLYKEYKKIYDDLERMLPESRKMKGLIPCHYEDKALVSPSKWWKNLTTSKDKQYLSTLGGEVYRQIPIGYSRALDVNESSNDILSSLMKYSLEVHHFKAKNDVLGGVDGITAVLEKYKPFDPTQQSKTKSELNNRRDAIKKFIKQVFYNETRASDAWYDKAIDFFAKGTSVMRMAIKPSNAIANIIMGNYANFSEAYGGRNFTTKDLLKAEAQYFELIATNPQKLVNMINTLDAIQGRYNIEVGQDFKSMKSKIGIDNIFTLQDLGEHQIQGVAMLALLEAKKVPIPEDGSFDLKTLPDNFIDTLHELNKANHGVYNQFDRLYMQDQALFRLFLQFRKWIIPTFRSKFSGLTEDWWNPHGTNKYRIDIESGTVEAGYYGMFSRFIWGYLKDLKRLPNILADAKNLDPIAKEGVKRTLRDGASLLAITALFLPLAGADDDEWVDEEHGDIANWVHWEIIYQLERLRADLALYIPFLGFKDEMRIVNQPFAAASTAVQMYELASMMFDIEEREDGTYGWEQYKRDYGRYHKGDLKMWSRVSKLNPADNPLEDLSPKIQYNNFKASSNA